MNIVRFGFVVGAVLIFNGIAQSATITETLTGVIYSGFSDGLGLFPGATDGETATLSFTYDIGTLLANGQYEINPTQADGYNDNTADDAITESFTIANSTYLQNDNEAYASTNNAVTDCILECGPSLSLQIINETPDPPLPPPQQSMLIAIYTESALPLGSLADQSAITAYLAQATYAEITVQGQFTYTQFQIDDLSVSSAPEPTTWELMVVAMGLAGFALYTKGNSVSWSALSDLTSARASGPARGATGGYRS